MSDLVEQIKADREDGTPGPWWSEDGILIWACYEAPPRHIYDARFGVCDVRPQAYCPGPPVEERDANARRIARVPDLEDAYLAAHARIEAQAELIAELTEALSPLRDIEVIPKAIDEDVVVVTVGTLRRAIDALARAEEAQK